ncbi:MAG: DUF4080 domain-containing protein [Deltaproteobacteria bacterium]|nr:DUF4080 domain-containing protein [Deltaproteobacteria bacterium]
MADIVLATINARYSHTSLGLRYLRANLGHWREHSQIIEFTLEERPNDIVECILALKPRILGLGVYIWNARITAELIGILKRIRPELFIVLGGPEVSYDSKSIAMVAQADHVITGEGEESFVELINDYFANKQPATKIIHGSLPDLSRIQLPYSEYSDIDIQQRIIYLEASRGCSFGCEFCLSALNRKVRWVPLDNLFIAMTNLWQRGLRHFRFVDRTFNIKPEISYKILEFFINKICPELFVHVEVIADQLPEQLLNIMAQFPKGTLQLEIGVQSLNDKIVARVGRKQKANQVVKSITKLRKKTQAHLHADLIIGLPGENLPSIAQSFDRLYATNPHEIQVGILKRLPGALIARHDTDWQMVYAQLPPYELLQNSCLDFMLVQRLKRFARYWDLVANSGRFITATKALCTTESPFFSFLDFAEWLFIKIKKTHQITPMRLASMLSTYLVEKRGMSSIEAQQLFESTSNDNNKGKSANNLIKNKQPKRQTRHHHN